MNRNQLTCFGVNGTDPRLYYLDEALGDQSNVWELGWVNRRVAPFGGPWLVCILKTLSA